nr:B3 domain-containing protein Os03g0212300-like [Aegilops tauschii subsp. strangulata]
MPKVKAMLEAGAPDGAAIGEAAEAEVAEAELHGPPRSRLRLPEAFARVLQIDRLPRVRLHRKGCCHSDMWVNTRFLAPHVMLLRWGWKTFARAHCLMDGHVLCFKLAESDLLSTKVFGRSGHKRGCCAESSTDDESSSLGDSEEEDIDGDDEGSGREDDGSD